eukprot:1377592-Amorphochlora_amoeboformis.AAC.3
MTTLSMLPRAPGNPDTNLDPNLTLSFDLALTLALARLAVFSGEDASYIFEFDSPEGAVMSFVRKYIA